MRIPRRALWAAPGLLALAVLAAMPAAADFVINDDLIVDGSACIGFDCVNGESFGFDTLRLKEHNLRIKADDTSTASSFPDTDWQITFNESANGGAHKFSIDDISHARTPFTIEANAPSHSLYVDDGGRIGLGTSVPSVELHIVDGDSPSLRLAQDGSSGFSPQTWDVAGNETNFFIRDVTNGSQLPFRIRPDAPSNSIFIDTDGAVGLQTSSPNTSLDIFRSGNQTTVDIGMRNASSDWRFQNFNDDFRITKAGTGNAEMSLDGSGNLTILGGLVTSGGGGACTVGDPCDRVFSPEFELESIEEHAEYMWSNRHLKGVGPTLEKGPINITRKTGGLINELEKAHIYIEQLHRELAHLEGRLEALETARGAVVDGG